MENYLMPLQREQGLPVVQIDMRSGQTIQGFSGTVQTHASLSHLWGARWHPLCCFLVVAEWRWQSAWWVVICRIFMALIWKNVCGLHVWPCVAER